MNLSEQIKNCQNCPLYLDCYNPLSGFGNTKDCELLIIIDKPTKEDDLVNELCYDRKGKYLKKILQNNECFKSDKIYITSALKCTPYHPYSNKDVKKCSEWLKLEIDLLQPSYVICMGTTAIQFFRHIYGLPSQKISKLAMNIEIIKNMIVGYFYSTESLFGCGQKLTQNFNKLLLKFRKEYNNVRENMAILG